MAAAIINKPGLKTRERAAQVLSVSDDCCNDIGCGGGGGGGGGSGACGLHFIEASRRRLSDATQHAAHRRSTFDANRRAERDKEFVCGGCKL